MQLRWNTLFHLGAASLLVLSVTACKPEGNGPTIGELQSKGAKLLTKAEFSKALPQTISTVWPNKEGEIIELTYKSDGTLAGREKHYASGTISDATGTWSFDESGALCVDKKFVQWDTSFKGCNIAYALGNELYFAPPGSGASTKTFTLAPPKR